MSSPEPIADRIAVVRGLRVILDADLARLYGVETRRLNEQVRRNAGRFPAEFMFRMTNHEVAHLKSQIATSKLRPNRRAGAASDSCRRISRTSAGRALRQAERAASKTSEKHTT